jgi:FAD/FMN-containing dehydrogenase
MVAPGGIELFAADMTATIAADVPLADVQRRLADVGQWLPADADRAEATVGELVARNSTGPLRLGYGGWRDLLLGCQFTNGRDELITAGGRAVKNVAGYDLTKFMVGQHGVFGKLVTLTTRTYRRPAFGLVARFEPEVAKLGLLLPTACRPQWATIDARSLTCGYLGDERTIGFIESSIGAHAPRTVEQIAPFTGEGAHVPRFAPRSRGASFRASVPPAAIVAFAQAAGARDWIADPAFGIVLGNFDEAAGRDTVQSAAATVGGQVTFYDAAGVPSFAPATSGERLLLERLKTAFDPEGRLQPLPFA